MSHVSTLLALGEALKQAASEHDWPAVLRVDASLAELLSELQGTPPDAALKRALMAVQHLHQQVMAYCQAHSGELDARMMLSLRNREGAAAYAAFMNAEDLG